MPTIKQKLAVQKIVENHGNISKSMREVGYSENSAKNPKNLTESKGFHELCDELGLTDELLTSALVEDIKAKKGNRKAELELGFKVRGRMNDSEERGDTMNILIGDSVIDAIAKVYGGNREPGPPGA